MCYCFLKESPVFPLWGRLRLNNGRTAVPKARGRQRFMHLYTYISRERVRCDTQPPRKWHQWSFTHTNFIIYSLRNHILSLQMWPFIIQTQSVVNVRWPKSWAWAWWFLVHSYKVTVTSKAAQRLAKNWQIFLAGKVTITVTLQICRMVVLLVLLLTQLGCIFPVVSNASLSLSKNTYGLNSDLHIKMAKTRLKSIP